VSDSISHTRPGATPGGANTPLRVFSILTAVMTFVLVWVGGLVTSHGAGMAVPDWPNTYGYNMFFFPISKWMGGIFYEHSHRLIASGVGFLTTILAFWLFGYKSRKLLRGIGAFFFAIGIFLMIVRPAKLNDELLMIGVGAVGLVASFVWPRCEPAPKWLRTLGVIAFIAVVTQGVLGGLRVTQMKDELGIFHATLAQLFFCLVSAIALFQTKFWREINRRYATNLTEGEQIRGINPTATIDNRYAVGNNTSRDSSIRTGVLVTTCLILAQLILGATMRHQHAGLSIPDFPLAYGKLWPATDAESVTHYNQMRTEVEGYQFITGGQVILQMVHRLMALAIVIAVTTCFVRVFRQFGWSHLLTRWSCAWLVLICCQAFLGAATIWTGKSADIATAHVAFGALSLLSGALLTIVAFRLLAANAGTQTRAVSMENNFGISHSTT
jgi:cytochrome c oxidase assembly protein subunit 15